jgi:hypothetical protein
VNNFVNHGVVQFDDLVAPARFDLRISTQGLCSTLHNIVWNAASTAYEAAGMSWYWYIGSDGSTSVNYTG